MYLDWYFFYIVSKLDTSLLILFYFILLVGIICFRHEKIWCELCVALPEHLKDILHIIQSGL